MNLIFQTTFLKTFRMLLIGFGFLAMVCNAFSANNWFVRPGGAGSQNGQDWNNAWNVSGISWSSVQPGDTIWMAGGTYSAPLAFGKNGTAGNPITVKRATAANSAATGALGWNAISFDTQVVMPTTVTLNNHSYVTIDGSVDLGIKINHAGQGADGIYFGNSGPMAGITLKYIWVKGTPTANAYAGPGNGIRAAVVGANSPISNLLISHCTVDNVIEGIDSLGWQNATVEYCNILNCYNNPSTDASQQHPDWILFWPAAMANVIVRSCVFSNFYSEGIFFGGFPAQYCSNVYFYGNTFDNGPGGGYEIGVYAGGNGIHIINNTFLNNGQNNGVLFWSGVDNSGAEVVNNIFYKAGLGTSGAAHDYNAFSGITAATETHGIPSLAADAMVSPTTRNFHLSANIGATYARNKGQTRTADGSMNVDPDGNVRGADGAWDIGAYEYPGTVVVTTNPAILVSPTGLNFGSAPTNTTVTLTLTVQNTGGGTLTGAVTTASGPFTISPGTYSVGAGLSQTITVQFTPTALGGVTNTLMFTGGNGTTATVSGVGATNLPPVVSPIAYTGSDVDPNKSGLQIYAGSVIQYSGSVTSTNGNFLSWQWIYTVNSGAEIVYTNGTGTVRSISYNYMAGSAGSNYVWKLRVSNGFATSESDLSVGVEPPPAASSDLTFQAGSGSMTGPLASTNGYIYETTDVSGGSITNGGQAVYYFTVPVTGDYVVVVQVNAPNAAANSFWININTNTPPSAAAPLLPQDPTMICDVPLTLGFEKRIVSWRGNGGPDSPQFVPANFYLTSGATNQLIIVGREANVQIQSIAISPRPTPPPGLRVIGSSPN